MNPSTLPILFTGFAAFIIGLAIRPKWLAIVIPTAAALLWSAAQIGVFSHRGNNNDALAFFLGWSPIFVGAYAGVSGLGLFVAVVGKSIASRLGGTSGTGTNE